MLTDDLKSAWQLKAHPLIIILEKSFQVVSAHDLGSFWLHLLIGKQWPKQAKVVNLVDLIGS